MSAVAASAALLVVPAAATPMDASAAPEASTVRAQTDRPLLQLGDSGPSVAAWQRQMNILTRTNKVVVDGAYGAPTEQATIDFQRFFGLRVDGIVGERTRDTMRYMLAVSRDYTSLFTYEDGSINGYQSEGGYCFEIQFGDEFSVECGPRGRSPITAIAIAVEGRDEAQLIGTIDPVVDEVEVDTGEGALPADIVRDVPGLDRAVWSTALPPSAVDAVRATAGDGSEIRAIEIEDGQAYLVIEYGDRGPSVAVWQGRLNAVAGTGLGTDGVFGASTWLATVRFQQFFGLHVDGIVGDQTREAMEFVYAAVVGG